jgi:hypothetical protein
LLTLKTAEKGEIKAPTKPLPTPLKNPFTPSLLADLYGSMKIPEIPFPISSTPPETP